MDEDEAALLAELRAISNQSSAGNRFDEEAEAEAALDDLLGEDDDFMMEEDEKKFESPPRLVKEPDSRMRPPAVETVDSNGDESGFTWETATAGSPPLEETTQPSTFEGERGGAVEDDELLAELRAISNQSSSTDRFANNDEDNNAAIEDTPEAAESEPKRTFGNSPKAIPPWKQNKKPWRSNRSAVEENDADVVVVVAPPPRNDTTTDSVVVMGGGGNFKQESTFTGDRGGAAEDEELLAELRAISAKSSSTDRFAGSDDDGDNNENIEQLVSEPSATSRNTRPKSQDVPPWKQKRQQQPQRQTPPSNDDVVVAAPRKTTPVMSGGAGNFKQESTFTGERGGAAEDEELLALLRGVSSKSGAADRFAGDDDNEMPPKEEPVVEDIIVQSKPAPRRPPNKPAGTPPWKRGKAKTPQKATDVDVVIAAPPQREEQQSFPVDQAALTGGAGNFKKESNFSGERGGTAEDEELLALLRGVSAKSGAADRFADDEDGAMTHEEPVVDDVVVQSKPPPRRKPNKPTGVPPWKRGKAQQPKKSEDVDVVIAAPPPKQQQQQQQQQPEEQLNQAALGGGAGNFKQASTFTGDRGGAAEDEELLALLRGVSSKSGAADRFADDDDGNTPSSQSQSAVQDVVVHSKPAPRRTPNNAASGVPPWKRGKAQTVQKSADVDVVVAAPPPPKREEPVNQGALAGGAGNFKQESNFSGERGGAAEDEELLALLRGVSSKSGAADRFADDDDVVATHDQPEVEDVIVHSKPAPRRTPNKAASGVPPWKRGKAQTVQKPADVDVVVAALPPPKREEPVNQGALAGGAGNFKQESNFSGERGGAAEDEELLALLRGVSSKSGAADRFADGDDIAAPPEVEDVITQSKPAPRRTSNKAASGVPPWKRGKEQSAPKSAEVDVIVAAAPPPQNEEAEPIDESAFIGGAGNFKQESNFSGERGGAAEDAELLALLRGVSSKSGGADRFAEEDSGRTDEPRAVQSVPKPKPTNRKPASNAVPPWKQKKPQQANKQGAETIAVAAPKRSAPAPEPKGNFQSNTTFSGERGGAAEDAELLALLRGVSSYSGGGDRFADDTDPNLAPAPAPAPSRPAQRTPTKAPTMSASNPMPMGSPGGEDPIVVTPENLPSMIAEKDWKSRKAAYLFLSETIERAGGSNPTGELDGNAVFAGLDELVVSSLMDKNANALDAALQVCLNYADYCRGAESPECAHKITVALIKGNGFTSPRPTAAKVAKALEIKLMEVGPNSDSLKEVVGVLLDQGVTSRKPKIVQASASLILEAAHSFGATCLPLATVSAALPKLLAHSNKNVRDTALEIVAELCRALGSKAPMNGVIEKMKKAQVKDLDNLLEKQPASTPIKVGFRSQRSAGGGENPASAEDALAALQAGAAELEAERFANRPAVNLMEAIRKTDYAAKLKLAKWSEKVAGMKMILECGGEQPYKLAQPSSSCNYVPLIHDMKGILSHTHYLVVSKAMEIFAMLANGVGEKLYPNLRPLLPTLFSLSKDKKLTKGVSACLDAFFGNVLSFDHLLDSDSALPPAVSESKTKNALARAAAIDFLGRCVERRDSAGPRARLTESSAAGCGNFFVNKLGDSDANVRKSALNALKSLQKVEEDAVKRRIEAIIEELKDSNPRAYKSLAGGQQNAPTSSKSGAPSPSRASIPSPAKANGPPSRDLPKVSNQPKKAPVAVSRRPPNPLANIGNDETSTGDRPDLDTAVVRCDALNVPLWEAEDEDGGVRAGLESTNWKYRFEAIKTLAAFVSSREILESPSDIEMDTSCILVVVKEHTRGFKETNVNVTKSILELFLALCDYHEKAEQPFPQWAAEDGSIAATEKIADKKLSALAKNLLLSLCVVQPPNVVQASAFNAVRKLKSPVAHEEFLKWFKSFCNEFGAASIGPGITDAVSFLEEESKSKNIKVKKAALAVFGTMHTHLGPTFQAVALATVGKDQSLRDQLEKTFGEHPHDRSASTSDWPKCSLASLDKNSSTDGGSSGAGLTMEVPKLDLMSELPSDCLARMGSKEGKTSWKARKAAMEDVDAALKRCSGLLDTSRPKPLVDLLRALRERLSDSQSNLKPVAARLIGQILGAMDMAAQGKMGKVVYAPLINAAMNDNKKNMHDAAMQALSTGTSLAPLEGEGLNDQSLESFVNALVGELEESEYKAAGIADVLVLTKSFTDALPNLDGIASQRGETLGGRFSSVLVDALSSSKSDTRSAAETLLFECVKKEVFSAATVKKSVSRLKPAKQRSLGPMVAKLSLLSAEETDAEAAEERSIVTKASVKSTSSNRSDRTANSKSGAPLRITRKGMDGQRPQATVDEPPPKSLEPGQAPSGLANPLVSSSGGSGLQKSRTAMKLLTWPEYPEEPSGTALFNGLKKAWAPLIPADSLKTLFPDGGIRKQDDAVGGCELLSRAIVLERAGDGCAIIEQFNLIMKWTAIVLCCKESPVGLLALLKFLSDLFDFLRESKYELSDSEALLLIPMLLDKASVAKGRFKDSFIDLVDQVKCEELLPPKRMGPIVCVSLIEASSHPKATLLACRECFECIEKIGLSGIGKKGVIAGAKALSEAKLIENRSALLELMELVLSRMNGDMQRLTRICGSSLSGKARDLLEEKVKKSEKVAAGPRSGIPPPLSTSEGTARRRTSRISTSLKMTPSKQAGSSLRNTPRQSPQAAPPSLTPQRVFEADPREGPSSSFRDELPALDLRATLRDTPSGIPRPKSSQPMSPALSKLSSPRRLQTEEPVTGVARSLSFNAGDDPMSTEEGARRTMAIEGNTSDKIAVSSGTALPSSNLPHASPQRSVEAGHPGGESLGAAASLRARLMKIREKNKLPAGSGVDDRDGQEIQPPPSTNNVGLTSSINHNHMPLSRPAPTSEVSSREISVSRREEDQNELQLDDELDALLDDGPETSIAVDKSVDEDRLDSYLATIKALLHRDLPLEEEDPDVTAATDVLKSIHAAVSKQANLAVELDAPAVARLRDEIKAKANEVISILTNLISFGFDCHPTSCNAGMSVPLLSVNLASLMAIFRSEDLSKMAEVEDLTILIKEAGKALLDPRLGSSGAGAEALDEATSSQMVRAINKLAVQAATGTTRHVAFQALIALQLQLTTGSHGLDDAMYSSRLSRVVTKLFMRVVKAEESTFKPFSSATLDVEALLCCLDDALLACKKAREGGLPEDGIEACRHLARVLVLALMKERGDASTLLMVMEELGIDSYESSLGELASLCAAELGYPYTKPVRGADRDVSVLVSAVGSARQGPERDLAVDALRQYTATHGDDDLNTHLTEVSSAFRAFVLEQLGGSGTQDVQEAPAKTSASSMSERIKNLRSKINATEAVVQSAVDPVESQMEARNTGIVKTSLPEPPSPSAAAPDDDGPSATVRAFRQRLALANEKRTATASVPEETAEPVASSGSRAAALRARLQAVKRQAGQS